MTRSLVPVVLSVSLLAPSAGRGAPPSGADAATVRGESTQTRKRLTELEQLLRAGKAADAADGLQRVLDEAGDDLISVDGRQYVPARRYVHRFLSRLPAPTLASYRDRVEEPARALLVLGRPADEVPLEQPPERERVAGR